MPTPEINGMIFALTGEFLTTIDEDLADQSQYNFTGMARKIEQLSGLIEKSVHDIAQAMPDELSSSYKQAMGTLIDDQGKNYLLEFTKQLDEIGRGRRKTGMDVMESKWQVIAEIVRLLIEIAIYLALSFFTGGASASQILVAKLRSRFVLLTLFSHLLKRLHLMPALSEALAEAFTTFAVRLAMMNFAPDGRRPDGIDWGDIGKAAAFGAAAGFFTSLFENWAKNIVKSYDTNFLKDGPLFKDKPGPGPDLKLDTPNPKPGPDSPTPKPDPDSPTPKPGPDSPTPEPKPEPRPTPEPTPGPGPGPEPNPKPDPEPAPPPGGGPQDRPRPDLNIDPPPFLRDRPFTFRYDPAVWRSNPDLWRNQRLLENNADRPGALAGHYGLKGVLDFAAAGGGESVGEVLIKGAFEGDFSSNWTTFVGAGVSSKVEGGLADIAVNTGNELRTAIENLRSQPPTVSGGPDTDGPARSGGGDGPARSGGQPRTEFSDGDGPTPGAPRPPGSPETTDLDEYTGSPSPRPDLAESPPPYTPQDPPAYVPVDPPSYTPGPLPVTAAEDALWQQVHQGPPELREQALRDLAAIRGEQPPGPAEIGVRDGLYGNLSQHPEIRVVPTGDGPAAEIDADEVRRALESFGTPVTVDPPAAGEGTPTPPPGSGEPTGPDPVGETGANGAETAPGPNGTPGPAEVDTGGTTGDAPTTGDSPVTRGTPGDAVTGPPTADRTGTDADTDTDTGPGSRSETPPLTVIVSETPPSLVDGSPEAAALLDSAGADRAVVLGPPTGTDATGLPERGAFELTREGPGAPVQVRPLGGPEYVEGPDAPRNTAFPGANVLLPLADALGIPSVATATPPPTATATPPPASTPPPTSASPGPRPVTEGGPTGEPGAVEPAPGERVPESPVGAETEQRDTDPSAIKVVSGEQTPVISGTGPDATPTVTPDNPEKAAAEVEPRITTDGPATGQDIKPPVITTSSDSTSDVKPPPAPTGPTPPADIEPSGVTTPPDTAPDIKPLPVTTSTTPTTSTDVPAASKSAVDARPWTETATDLHVESGRDDESPTATPAAAPPPPGQITVRPADPGQGQPPRTLRDFVPEDQWWTFYIDPKNHQAALDAFPDDPGSYYDHDRSPGFQQGMVSAYTQFLGDPGTVATPMDSISYRTMHGLATGHLGRTIGWSGGGATQFPLRGETLADDIFDERIGDQLLVYDTTSRDWSMPLPKPRPVTILTRFMHNNPSLATNYGKNAAPGLVDTLFQQHYARVSEPDADDTAKLASIVRTIRALHVVHPFQDGNLRSNVQILLPKLLLEQGLRPVVPDNMYSLFQGGRSVPQMVESLIRNGALDTGSPRPPQGETAADPHLESGREGDMDTSDTPVAPIPTSTTDDASTRPPTPEPAVTTLDSRTVPFSELRRFVPQARFAPQPGVAVQTLTISQSPAEDGTGRSAGREALLGQDSFRGVRTTSAEPPPPGSTEAPPAPRTVFTGPPAALPGSGTERGADYFVGHGTPRTVTLGTDNAAYPTVRVSGVQLGELLKSWAQDGDQDRPLVLFSCETGQQPMIAGLPVAQHVANRTGRPVYAPTTEAGTAKDRDGQIRAVLGEGPDGPGRWRLFTPEPAGADLDRLARDAGLHAGPDPADAFARARTLQQIRTLREALGPDAEQHADNRESLAALAYVDGLRWHDPGTAARYGDGRMTPDLLDRMVTDWHTATNGTDVDPATGPTPGQYRAFLEAAAGLRAGATPATTLDTLLPPPPPELPPDTLVSQPDVLGLAYARSAQITWSLSNAPLPLSELGLGPDDTAELARRLHHPESAAPPAPPVRQDAPAPDGTPPPAAPALPVNSLVVNAHTARHVYGIPEKNFDKFRDVARDRNVVVDVRPTNPSAPRWLDAGAMPKPQDIKAKTVNEVDVLLGADAGNVGLVGYFQPVLPDQRSVPVDAWDRVVSRFNQRSTEFHELAGKMDRYEADGKFTVHEGIVFGFDGEGERRPITGDHDLFDVSSPDGSRISHPEHDALIDEMRAKDMAVVHGAHMFWNPPTAFDKSVFDKIVSSHQGPSGEPLLRFSPNSDHAVLTWTQKLKPGQVDSYTARHTYGIPEKNFDKFRDVARDRNVVVDVRPTNPSAPRWLDAGAMPKPQDIKAKTVNEVDVLLGADAGTIGLVGYFQPVLPDQGSVPVDAWDRVVSRFNQRSTEFHELAGKMDRYEADGKFTVHKGIVFGFDEEGGRRPITGDHDLFDVSSPDGARISPLDHDALIDEMRAKDMAVAHGAHMFWNPPTAFDKSVFDKIVSSHEGATGEPLLRFSPGNDHAVLVHPEPLRDSPPPARPESIAEDMQLSGKATGTPGLADTVRADGQAFRRLPARADGDCLFRSLLDTARTRPVPPPWAARNVTGLRSLLRDRLAGSELLAPDVEATPDPVLAVVDDLRMTALAGVRNPEARERIGQRWDRIEQAVVTGGDARRWRQILKDSGYSHLADVAPTPADARRLGTDGLILAAAELPALWSSPFADALPLALAHTLDIELRLVRPEGSAPASTSVTPLNPGGRSGTLHVAYNGTDHFDALVPAASMPAPATTPTPPPVPAPATPDPAGPDVFGAWLRSLGGVTDLDGPAEETPDRGDPVPLETQLERQRPARLLTGEDARPPGPTPRTVTFDDGSRLPTVLISPDADPDDGSTGPGARPAGTPRTGLLNGLGVVTLRSPEQVAKEVFDQLPKKLRAQFDASELLRMLKDQPGAFTAPRGARFVGREKSGVGHEMVVEAVPYHRWERFSEVGGATVRLDTMRRGQAGTGGGRSVGVGRRVAAALGMGPPLNWMLKIGVSLGWTRRTDYTQGTQAYHQSEYRAWEGSHLHLDDVHYRVRVERVTEAPQPPAPTTPGPGTPPAATPRWQRSQVHSAAFAVRDGLSWRLPDDLTVPFKGPKRAPETLTFPDGAEPRITDTTALHLTDPPEDVALAISGARPGSSAHRTLVSYVRPGRLLGLFGRFAGPVSGPELTRGSGQHPLGHLIVERSIPHRATLVTESVKAEVRDLTQTTYQNQRAHVRDTRLGVQVTAGPNYTLIGPETDVRLQGGPLVRTDLSAGRGHYLGTDAARKVTGRVRNHPMALYRVERTLMVRKAGQPASAALPVRVVSLDWYSTQDARRLAGWDSRTPGATGPNPDAEPPVPWYLTRQDPVHLGGQVRAEGFVPDQRPPAPATTTTAPAPATTTPAPVPVVPAPTPAPQDPLKAFTDTVLDTLHRAYPSLFVPPLMLRHPHLAKLWYGDGRMRTALHNERQVREALNRPSLAQSLDDLTTTGVPVTLTEDGKVRRGHHTLILRARLSDRRFETTLGERSLRNAVIGTEISGQGQQESTTLSAGVELGISPRDHDKDPGTGLPRQAGNVSLGARHAQTRTRATKNTVAVAHDQLTFQNGADLYSYQVELGATFEGHRRPRGWTRLVSVGLLGAGVFVSKVGEHPLFTRGNETVGRVELAVPAAHGSDRHAPADPPATGPAPTPAPAPVPRPLSSTDADQLLDGTPPLPRTSASDRQLVNKLLSAPHVVLSTEGGEQRQRLVQDTADRATGTSWHVSAPGTPIRTALRRAMANLGVAGQLGQYLGPFGSRITGLTGAGPFSTHYLKAAVRGELDNVRVKSDPKPGSLEATIGNEHRVAGTSGSGSRTTLGIQGAVTPVQQAPGQQAVVGAYSTALQYAWGKGRSVSQTLTRGRNTTLSYAGRMYLVVADAAETVAVRDRWTAAMGAVGTRSGGRISAAAGRISDRLGRGLSPRRAAAALQRIRDAVMFHLPMQDAIEAGLAPDGLGTRTPANLGGGYRLPPFLLRRRFPSHPSGQLDASRAAQQLMGQLERMGVPSHDREQVLQRLSPDFLRSHVHELTTDGMALPVHYRTWTSPHHLPVGGSPGQLRLTLTPVTTTVERLRTGYELEDYRTTARDDVDGRSQDRGADVTLSASERAAGSGALVANPALQGTAAKQRSSNVTEAVGSTAMPNIATTQAHAEIVTTYTLTATLVDASGRPLGPTATAPVGSLNEILPASLLTPDGDGIDGALTEQDVPEPPRAVTVLTADQARPESIARWRTTDRETGERDPDILPFDDVIGSGILAVDILGSANVRDALTLATARADGFPGDLDLGERHTGTTLAERVRMARHTPLTGLGTAPAQAQQEATSQVGLTAGFREALGADGSPLPTQSSARLLGQSHTADSRLYAKMHRAGARLLAVENKPRMEAMQRRKTGDALDAGITDNVEGAVSTSPLAGNSNAGVTNPGATVPIGGANDATALRSATDTTLGTHVKVVTDRSMLFAVPVSWLSVAEVDHRVTDSRPIQALGKPQRGPRAVEAETTALVWLREDIARDHGLLDDTTFPDEARTAWDDQAKSAADLATAEKNYYDARARTRETWLDLSPEEQAALGDDDRATALPRGVAQSPAVTAWQTARDEVRRRQRHLDDAAKDHHRLHLAAARLTAHHQGSGSVPVKDVPQEYTEPDWRSEAPEPYTVTDATESAPRTLTSPDGHTVHEVHEVPHDGASFFHALLTTAQDRGKLPYLLDADLADRFAADPGDPAVTAQAVDAVRDRLAWALADNGNEDLLDGLALDAADTFTQAELDYAEIDLTEAQQAEFDALGRLPQTVWPSPEQRVALATAALYRPFTAEPTPETPDAGDPAPPERRAGDHGGADVLPALAARVLGTPVTVVTGEGRRQMFLPHGADPATADAASGPVLFAAEGFFSAALTPGTTPPLTTALPTPPTTGTTTAGTVPGETTAGTVPGAKATGTGPGAGSSTETTPKPPAHRSHATPPWLPPADADGPRYRLDRDGLLTAPDGATYTQGAPAGRGNGFFAALSTALRHAAGQPGREPRAAARLRTRAGASPAQLMRLNGLPGERPDRDTLFSPPPPGGRKGAPALSQDALDGRLRRHLASAPWGPDADRAVAEWAAKATGATVTLIEENGTAHTYAGPSADVPHLRLRRRGGDFVPLLLRTPAKAPAPAPAPKPKTATPKPETPEPPVPKPKAPESPKAPTDGDLPGLPGEEEAYELSPLSGTEPRPQPLTQPHENTGIRTATGSGNETDSDSDSDSEGEEDTPIWADPEWLTAVFGPQWNRAPRARLQETSQALYELVEEAAGGRPTRDGLADLVRHVLHLPLRARVSNQDVLDLGALALEASSDDLATADDLAGYFVDRQIETRRDALAEETQLRDPDRTPAGRDFTGANRGLPAPDSYLAERSGRAAVQSPEWQKPYLFVAGAAEGGGVEIVTPWRTFVVRDAEEMARIISYDSRRPGGADIVLALPPAFAAQVAHLVAGTTARPVWYPLGPAEVATHPTTGAAHLVVHRREGEAGPDWTTPPPPREPGLPGARDPGSGDSDTDDGPDSDDGSDSGSTSDGDAEFDRLADLAQFERRVDALRPRPLVTRAYEVLDDSGTGVLFTEPGPRTVGEVRTADGAEGPALVLPHQTPVAVPAASRPPLHISEDRTVALLSAGDDTTGRGRQVYATRTAIERSSARLAAAGAGVRLEADPSVRVVLDQEDGTPGEPLFRVEPRFLTGSGASEHAFTRDFARTVAGTDAAPLSHLAFRAPDGTVATAPVNGLHGREVTGTHHLAQALTEVAHGTRPATGVTPDWAVRQTGRDPRFTGGVVGAPTPGEAYGQALSHTQDNARRGPLTQAAARAGVNQFAWAEVGEGYLIQSVSTTNDGGAQLFTHNHAKPGDPVGPHAPYHFAQVVLAGEDGTHQITLENETHSRTPIPADQLDAVVDENLDRYDEAQLNGLARESEGRAATARRDGAAPAEVARLESFARTARALAAVHEAEHVRWYFAEDRPEHALAQREVDQARARARDAVRSAAPVEEDKDQWFFRAYSKRPGESAHEVNAALLSESSPAVSNPLTTVALHGHALRPDQRTVRFAEQQHTPSPDADENLDALALSLARTGLWNHANGLPLPAVTVTGHGNRSRTSAQKRAEAVGKALGDRLGRLLRTFQEGAPGPHIRLADFTLTLDAQRVRRATDPDRGRLVTVDIDDRRHTSRPAPARPAPAGEPNRTEPPALARPTAEPAPGVSQRAGTDPATGTPATGTPPTRPGTTASATTPSDRAPSRPGRRSATPSPDRGTPVPAWVRARIRYAEESVAFERRLAEHLAENTAVTEEFRKMARAAWDRARQKYPRALDTFGSENPSMPGTVGTSRPVLQQMLRTGNLRELTTFLFQGISSDLVPEMLGGREDPNPAIEEERPSRRQAEGRAELERLAAELNLDDTLSVPEKQAALARATRRHAVRTDPDDVRPPLSRAERPYAVNELGLTWMPASSVYDLAMASGLQGASEDTGGLVLTGTAGSTYRFLVHAARMRDQWGVDLDLGLIRAGMIATSLSAGHHSFHEVMRGAQLALDGLPGHDPALDYRDNWGRYWNVHPLTEQELRDHVARDGLFPDEHARAVLDVT
ncbi:WXG100-like domain-containing protein [Streptomyces anulatus]|uniref:WXG100-like domain-containing protein n=1 Tax=Streptomyces anulatus TaxID=1892 RepID=UPI0036277A74